jgi:hypothetical protein
MAAVMPARAAGDGKANESDRHERNDEGQMCHLKGKSSDAASANSCRCANATLSSSLPARLMSPLCRTLPLKFESSSAQSA